MPLAQKSNLPVLPSAPADFGKRVSLPIPQTGQDPKVHAARLIGAIRAANARLDNDRAFYEGVIEQFGAPEEETH